MYQHSTFPVIFFTLLLNTIYISLFQPYWPLKVTPLCDAVDPADSVWSHVSSHGWGWLLFFRSLSFNQPRTIMFITKGPFLLMHKINEGAVTCRHCTHEQLLQSCCKAWRSSADLFLPFCHTVYNNNKINLIDQIKEWTDLATLWSISCHWPLATVSRSTEQWLKS